MLAIHVKDSRFNDFNDFTRLSIPFRGSHESCYGINDLLPDRSFDHCYESLRCCEPADFLLPLKDSIRGQIEINITRRVAAIKP